MAKNTVKIQDVVIGEGIPKICVPILGETDEEILAEAELLLRLSGDIAEWRIDWYDRALDTDAVLQILGKLRKALGQKPLLATFRTAGEGGEKAVSPEKYRELCRKIIESGDADIIDIELFMGEELMREMAGRGREMGVKVLASNHDFRRTPECGEIISRLKRMQALGADILKIAVMPGCPKDVLTLLEATEEMSRAIADRPIVTMAMGGEGAISRLAGEVFGSALTFGSAKRASAPGQMAAPDLDAALRMLHENLENNSK